MTFLTGVLFCSKSNLVNPDSCVVIPDKSALPPPDVWPTHCNVDDDVSYPKTLFVDGNVGTSAISTSDDIVVPAVFWSTQSKLPFPSVFNTWPSLPSLSGKVRVYSASAECGGPFIFTPCELFSQFNVILPLPFVVSPKTVILASTFWTPVPLKSPVENDGEPSS